MRKSILGIALGAVAMTLASCEQRAAAPVPDLPGLWAREYIGFEPPDSGPGPIANLSRIPTGQANLDVPVGDYKNPLLKPAAAEVLKKRGEISLSGKNFPQPPTNAARIPCLTSCGSGRFSSFNRRMRWSSSI